MPDLPLELSVTYVSELLASGKAKPRLIDCREQDEWDICHIEGAELMPLSNFVEAAGKLTDKDAHLVVYCHHGMRSLRATHWLRQQGFANTQSMSGGIDAWADMIEPEMRRY
jgi:adenylyltransferase/sulfurtransferase